MGHDSVSFFERYWQAGAFVVIVAVLGWSLWAVATQHANVMHCNESLEGVAVKEGTGGRVVCIRRDSVLKVYQ